MVGAGRKFRYSVSVLAISMALSGCADSYFRPMLKMDRTTYVKENKPKLNNDQIKTFKNLPKNLDLAIKYADWVKSNYRDAVDDEIFARTITGTLLLQLGTATVGLGAAGVAGQEVLITGLGASSLYATGSFLDNSPRQKAYLVGYSAIQCAIDAVTPLNYYLQNDGDFKRFKTLLGQDENPEKNNSKN